MNNLLYWGDHLNLIPVEYLGATGILLLAVRVQTIRLLLRKSQVPLYISFLYLLFGCLFFIFTFWGTVMTAWWMLPFGFFLWYFLHAPFYNVMKGWLNNMNSPTPINDAQETPEGYKRIDVEFTEEGTAAMNKNLQLYGSFAKAEGKELYVDPKVLEGMKAQGLSEYVRDLIDQLPYGNFADKELAGIMDKAIKAQVKAYAVHNLPIYLYQAATMFEVAGDSENAKAFFNSFLRAQSNFEPDTVDTLFLNQMGFDIPTLVATAREKVA